MSTPQVPENFVAGLEGVVAFTTEIAEPDKDGGALRYRGVDIEDLVSHRVTFGDVWALLVDGEFGRGLPAAEPFPLHVHSGDVRVDVQRLRLRRPREEHEAKGGPCTRLCGQVPFVGREVLGTIRL